MKFHCSPKKQLLLFTISARGIQTYPSSHRSFSVTVTEPVHSHQTPIRGRKYSESEQLAGCL